MIYCERITDPQYRINLANLTEILNDSNAAVAALESNNGYSLDKAPNGKDSILIKSLLAILKEQYPTLSDSEILKKAILIKILTFSDSFKEWFGDWLKINTFNLDDIDYSKVDVEFHDKLWKSDETKSNKTIRIYLKNQHDKGYFELVKDQEFGQFSVHLKTDKSKLQSGDTKILFEELSKAIPNGAIVSTWGSLSEDGIRALPNIGRGMLLIGERTATRKSDGSAITIPVYQKGEGVSKVVDENGEPLVVYTGIPVKGLTEFSLNSKARMSLTDTIKKGFYFSDINTAKLYTKGEPVYKTTDKVNEELAKKINLFYRSGDLYNSETQEFALNSIGLPLDVIEEYLNQFTIEETGEPYLFEIPEGEIIPAFLNIKNPVYIKHNGKTISYLSKEDIDKINNSEGAIIEDIDEHTIDDFTNTHSTDYIVFNPNQIKSVFNDGTYSLTDNNIYHEHFSDLLFGTSSDRDTRFIKYFLDNTETKIEIPLENLIKSLLNNPQYSGLYSLLTQRHLTTRKHSLIEGVKIILERPFLSSSERQRAKFDRRRAYYDANTKEIHINVENEFVNGNADSVIWHELMHAMTVNRLQDPKYRLKFQAILDDYLEVHYDYIYAHEHGLEEFVADIWTDQKLIDRLKKIPSKRSSFKTLWDNIKAWFLNIFDIDDNSLFAEASVELDRMFDEIETYRTTDKFYEHASNLDLDTKDILTLIKYQGRKDGLSEEVINLQLKAYLEEEPWMIKNAKTLIDKLGIRQALLHTLGYDFNDELYSENGIFNWDHYLGGIDLNEEIEVATLDFEERFSALVNYQVDPAEIIMPKLYRSNFNFGNRSLSEITPEYFKRANPFYFSDLKPVKDGKTESKGKIDFLIRCHSYKFNIAVLDKLSKHPDEEENSNLSNLTLVNMNSIKIEDGYRIDDSGKRLYAIPDDLSSWRIYVDKRGNETIVFRKDENYIKNIKRLISSLDSTDLVSIQGFFDNIDPTDEWINYIISHNHIKTHNSLLRLCIGLDSDSMRLQLYEIYANEKNIKYYKNDLANTLYNSFLKTLEIISVRIPTQAFQSIMAAKVVGLTNDEDNNVFVNRWQFWLLGSDLDIDKSYMMGPDISIKGTYNHWSPISNLTTPELTKISDTLPVPNLKLLTLPEKAYTVTSGELVYITSKNIDFELDKLVRDWINVSTDLKRLANEYNIYSKDKLKLTIKLKIESLILQYLTTHNTFNISQDLIDNPELKYLISKLNRHNSHVVTSEEARNVILRHILRISLDERNMKASYSPIDVAMDYFKTALKKITDDNANLRDLDDGGLSIARMQHNTSVGKKDVGIMANGLKAFFALTLYLNKHRKDKNFIKSNAWFLTRLNITGKDDYFSTISDILFERTAIQLLNAELLKCLPPGSTDTLKFVDHDASLLISSLVSLATDNAKELALAKMNASIELACMHLFLVTMGYTGEEIVNFTAKNPEFKELSDLMNSGRISGTTLNVRSALDVLISNTENVEKIRKYKEIEYIYNSAQEMSTIAKICSINQGTKVDELDSDVFYKNIENVILQQVHLIFNPKNELKIEFNPQTWHFTIDNISEFVSYTHNIKLHSSELDFRTQQALEELNRINSANHYMDSTFKIDLKRYFNDSKYREFCVDFYNLFKFNFNVLDCINNLPHFYEMLHAFVIAESTINEFNSRARTILDYSKDAYFGERVFNRALVTGYTASGETTSKYKVVFDRKYYNDSIKNQAGRFYDDYIMSEFLKEYGENYSFEYRGVDDKIHSINLQTNEGVLDFCNFMAYTLIPFLQLNMPENTFLQYIRPDFKKLRRGQKELFLPAYKFNFDVDNLTSVSDQNKSFYIQQGFVDLMVTKKGKPLTLSTLDFDMVKNGDLRITELLYLYDKLVHLGGSNLNSLDRAFELYLAKSLRSKHNTIAKQLAKIIQEHDLGIRPDIKLDPVLFTAYCYRNQVLRKQKGIFRYDVKFNKDTKRWDEKNAPSLDINGKFLFNLEHSNTDNTQLKSELFIKALRQGLINIELINGEYILYNIYGDDIELRSKNLELSLEGLLTDLINLKSTDPDTFSEFILFVEDTNVKYSNSNKLKSYETLSAYKKFAKRMSDLGLEVSIINDPNGPNGYVEDGTIIINSAKNITTTPLHELMHVVLAIMKLDDYDSFDRLMKLMLNNSKIVQLIYNDINLSLEYENLMKNDKIEEAFCRFLEKWIIDNNIIFNTVDDNVDLNLEIQQALIPYINKTFGISSSISLLEFLTDTISDLPKYGSTLFMKTKQDSTGYLALKTKVIQDAKITAYIQDLIKQKLLTETNC